MSKYTLLESMMEIHELQKEAIIQWGENIAFKKRVKELSQQLRSSELLTLVFSFIVIEQLTGEIPSLKRIAKSMGLNSNHYIHVNQELKFLRKRGWLKSIFRRYQPTVDEYAVPKRIIDAILENNAMKLDMESFETVNESLIQFNEYTQQILEELDKYELAEVMIDYAQQYKHFEPIKSILDNKKIVDEEKIILLFACSEYIHGQKEVNYEAHIEYFFEVKSATSYRLRKRIGSSNSELIQSGFLSYEFPGLADTQNMVLGEALTKFLEIEQILEIKKEFTTKLCQLIKPENISTQELYFDQEMKSQIEKLKQLLDEDHFKLLQQRMQEKKMKEGVTMLFYGSPGTGKTELAKQLALHTNRVVLMVDISSIKSMWVGESEKNTRKIFSEYYAAKKYFPQAPILLFNEADALISKRGEASHSVDQMMNSIQNILLQEIEDFNGILIATSNLEKNFDPAFDRRFLFKICFKNPESKIRYQILKNKLNCLSDDEISLLAENYELSGGQIQNIEKQIVMHELLNLTQKISLTTIQDFIDQEVNFKTLKRKSLGYNQNN
jgi:hypothetical protein